MADSGPSRTDVARENAALRAENAELRAQNVALGEEISALKATSESMARTIAALEKKRVFRHECG